MNNHPQACKGCLQNNYIPTAHNLAHLLAPNQKENDQRGQGMTVQPIDNRWSIKLAINLCSTLSTRISPLWATLLGVLEMPKKKSLKRNEKWARHSFRDNLLRGMKVHRQQDLTRWILTPIRIKGVVHFNMKKQITT